MQRVVLGLAVACLLSCGDGAPEKAAPGPMLESCSDHPGEWIAGSAAQTIDLMVVEVPPGKSHLKVTLEGGLDFRAMIREEGQTHLFDTDHCYIGADRTTEDRFGAVAGRRYVISVGLCGGYSAPFTYKLAACSGEGRYERELNDYTHVNTLALGEPMGAKVDHYRDEDSFRVSVPAGKSKLRLKFDPAPRAQAWPFDPEKVGFSIYLEDAGKNVLDKDLFVRQATVSEHEIPVEGGRDYDLRVLAFGSNPVGPEYQVTVEAE